MSFELMLACAEGVVCPSQNIYEACDTDDAQQTLFHQRERRQQFALGLWNTASVNAHQRAMWNVPIAQLPVAALANGDLGFVTADSWL
eukprot:365715-Chlamydomonas_euryale.AAC.6